MNIIKKDNILIPKKDIDLSKWAIIACDQFTKDTTYWNDIKKYVGSAPSTLNFMIPEIFINNKSIDCINNIKNSYESNLYQTIEDSYILINRQTPYHKKRLGLVCCIDLEDYDFKEGSKPLIRASEGTLQERIIPRISIKEKALIEFPHIILLYDDRNLNILENLYSEKTKFEKIYDFELNGNGGHLEGYRINTIDLNVEFEKLQKMDYMQKISTLDNQLLFLVGDGNHSLATCKVCWDKIKNNLSPQEKETHPARFCLVEICNINDTGIEFYPIHRVLFNYDKKCINDLQNLYKGNDYIEYNLYFDNHLEKYKLPKNTISAIKIVQKYLDTYLKECPKASIDYIHDDINVINTCKQNKALGIFLPTIAKNEIFEYVANYGILPKKSFSIGHSEEKRYYLEGKIIKKM